MALSMFDEIMADADGPLDEVFAKPYQVRWQGETITIDATLQSHASIAESVAGRSSEAAMMESWHGHNFLIKAADVIFSGKQIDPQAGMELAEPLTGGGFKIYELAPPDGQRVFEPIDAEARKLMIFALEVRTEAAV